jgi:hypothetical protein
VDVEAFVFHDARDDRASERFVKWIDDHPDGYYINCKTAKKMMLHGSSCSGVIFDPPRNLAKHKKICSLDRDGLVRWAARQSDEPLKFCKRCPSA